MSIQFDWNFKRFFYLYNFFIILKHINNIFSAVDENLQYGNVENFRVIALEPHNEIRAQLTETILGTNKTKMYNNL